MPTKEKVEETNKPIFEVLNNLNVGDHTEKVEDDFGHSLTYLSWVWAWASVKKLYPDAQYEVIKFDGIPYVFDEKTGYMVYTTVTIGGMTHEMWLPVMDSKNKAMKAEPYTYQTKKGERTVNAATMFDINKTIMRCLTKNLAMFGLGLYIYAGEDLPEQEKAEAKANQKEALVGELKDLYAKAGGADFDAWFKKTTDNKEFNAQLFASMKATLLKQINKKAEEQK